MTDESRSNWLARLGIPPGRLGWLVFFVITVGLGIAGNLLTYDNLPFQDAVYLTARLFILELDVFREQPHWVLWIAAVLAPILVLRGFAELFRERLQGVTVRFLVRPRAVVFGADHRAVALVAAEAGRGPWQRWRHGVVVADPDPGRLAAVREKGAWGVAADGESATALRKAGVRRTGDVVVVTGDDRRNAAIATAVREFPTTTRWFGRRLSREVFVEVEDPGLARTLERSTPPGDVVTVPFSGSTLAASDVLDALDAVDDPLLQAGDDQPSLVLFGQGPLVDAVILELRRRRQVQVLRATTAAVGTPRVLVVGPDAEERVRGLHALLGAELGLLEIQAVHDSLGQALTLTASTARALLSYPHPRVLVLVADDLAGGGIALTLARHLGRAGKLALVTEGPATTFGDEIVEQTTSDPTLAPVRIFRVPATSYPLRRLREHRSLDRLARALYESTPGHGSWASASPEVRDDARGPAQDLLDDLDTRKVRLRGNAFMAFDPPQRRVLEGLGITDLIAVARAGLSPDLNDPAVLVDIGNSLLPAGHPSAMAVWCEVARLSSSAAQVEGYEVEPGPDADDVRRLLLLRRAALGDGGTGLAELVTGDPLPEEMVLVVGGSAADVPDELREILRWALATPTYRGVIVEPVGDTGVGRALRALAGPEIRSQGVDAAAARRYVLDLWTRLAAAGRGPLRVLAVPGDPTLWPQVQLLRTLGARVGWLPMGRAGEPVPDPERQLLGGTARVVDLPVDRATVRAFLRPTTWTGTSAARDVVAAALHDEYVRRHGAIKQPDDPVLRPFAQLTSVLRNSNRAVVDDIPAKLEAVGMHLCPLAAAAWPDGWPEGATLELLAEMEHGRWNAERLLAGWESGDRDTARFLSPHLLPWSDLTESTRGWDRDLVGDIPNVLRRAGLGAS